MFLVKPVKLLLHKIIPRDKKFYLFLKRIYRYRRWRPQRIKDLDKLLHEYNSFKKGMVSFIQIGSNDGLNGDPIHDLVIENKWKGILVEPIPEIYEKLKYNYRDCIDHLVFENVAINENKNAQNIFYYVENSDNSLPEWVNQIGSFDKKVLLKHTEYVPEIENRIIEVRIHTESLEGLIARNKMEKINLIHIDTEGYDYVILRQINFQKIRPEIIIYEHKHLSEFLYKESIQYLKDNHYSLFYHDADTIAINKDILPELKLNKTWI